MYDYENHPECGYIESIGKITIKIGSVDPEITPNNVTTTTSLHYSIDK